jgi:ferritin-like metal-binding protein YciE
VAKLRDPRALMAHDLAYLLEAERSIARALPRMQKKASDGELAKRLDRHAEETRQQIKNLQQALKELGVGRPSAAQPAGAAALVQEFKESTSSVTGQLVDLVTLGVNARIEHYEIGAYENLIAMARALGEKRVGELLGENLKQEKQMLREGMDISKRLGKEATS